MRFIMPCTLDARKLPARLRGEAVHAHRGRQCAGVHELGHAREHLVGHKVLAGAVGVDDSLDQALGRIAVVRRQQLGSLR